MAASLHLEADIARYEGTKNSGSCTTACLCLGRYVPKYLFKGIDVVSQS